MLGFFFNLKFMLKGSEDEDQWPPKKQTRERKEGEKGENKAKILKEDQVFFSVFNFSEISNSSHTQFRLNSTQFKYVLNACYVQG